MLRVPRMQPQYSHIKLASQKPMLRQTEWGVQNEPITKNGLLQLTNSFSLKIEIEYKNLS